MRQLVDVQHKKKRKKEKQHKDDKSDKKDKKNQKSQKRTRSRSSSRKTVLPKHTSTSPQRDPPEDNTKVRVSCTDVTDERTGPRTAEKKKKIKEKPLREENHEGSQDQEKNDDEKRPETKGGWWHRFQAARDALKVQAQPPPATHQAPVEEEEAQQQHLPSQEQRHLQSLIKFWIESLPPLLEGRFLSPPQFWAIVHGLKAQHDQHWAAQGSSASA